MDSHGENPFANEGDDDDGEVSVTPSASPAAPHDPHVAPAMRPDAIDSRRPERPGQYPRDSRRDLEAPDSADKCSISPPAPPPPQFTDHPLSSPPPVPDDLARSVQNVSVADDPLGAPSAATPAMDLGPLGTPAAPDPPRSEPAPVAAAPAPAAPSPTPPRPPAAPVATHSASAMGVSYGDLLAPPPSYADSVMYADPVGYRPGASSEMHPRVPGDGGFGGTAGAAMSRTTHGGIAHTTGDVRASFAPPPVPGAGVAAAPTGEPRQMNSAPATNANEPPLNLNLAGTPPTPSYSPPTAGRNSPGIYQSSMRGVLETSVSDPQASANATGAFGKKIVLYRVVARCDFPEYVLQEHVTWRRFRDFVGLADRLADSHRGYFVPPRPDKTLTSSSDEDFVTRRMQQLDAYLRRLASHPVLRHSKELRVFLTAQNLEADETWYRMKNKVPVPMPVPMPPPGQAHVMPTPGQAHVMPMPGQENQFGGMNPQQTPPGMTAPYQPPAAPVTSPTRSRGAGKFFKEMKQTIVQSTAVGMMGGAFGLETHKPKIVEEDTAFITEKDRVLRMEQELAIASQKAERVLAAEQKHSDALGELGLECLKLSKMEEEEAGRMGSYTAAGAACQDMASQARKMGNATIRISRLSRSANNASAKSLDPLHDYLGMMPAVRKAVADRAETLLTLQTHLADVDSKKARIAKLEMDFSKMHKAEMLRRELAADEAAAEAARTEYSHIQGRHQEEFRRLEESRSREFKAMWLAFARTQVRHTEKVLQVWRAVAEDMGADPSEWADMSLAYKPTPENTP